MATQTLLVLNGSGMIGINLKMISPLQRSRKWTLLKLVESPLKLVLATTQVGSKENNLLEDALINKRLNSRIVLKMISEDEGLKIGDLIVPRSDQLRFGNFDSVGIKKVSCIAVDVNP